MLLYPITLILLLKQISQKMVHCILSLNIGMKIQIYHFP